MKHFLMTLVAAGSLALLAGAGGAQGTNITFGGIKQDTSLPVEVTADSLSVDQKSGSATFSGNVLIGQGEMRLSAARVLVVYAEDQSRIKRMEARGGVTLVNGQEAAEADAADYDIDAGTIVMTGNVLLTQGASALSAGKMTVDLETGQARMSGRVKTILQNGNN